MHKHHNHFKQASFSLVFLGFFLLVSCVQQEPEITVTFLPVFNSQAIKCDTQLELDETVWKLSQLQLFLHHFELQDLSGQWYASQMIVEPNTHSQVALLGGVCPNPQSWQVKLTSKLSSPQIRGIRFNIGVPAHLNHLNPLTQLAPLNQPDMFWTWQMGHKFARIELASPQHQWLFHLGATGCDSPSSVRAPKQSCLHPNSPTIELTDFSPDQEIYIRLDKMLHNLNLLQSPNCQSSMDTPSCKVLLPRWGIGRQQVIFSTEHFTKIN